MKRLFFTLFFCLPIIANASQISLVLDNPSLEQVITEIESQSNMKFAFGNEVEIETKLPGKYNFQNEDLDDIIKVLSTRTPFTFRVVGTNITITVDPPIKKAKVEDSKPQVSVEGKVTDSDGMPLPSVTVQEKGTDNGVMTDFDGNYSIEVRSDESVLIFTYVGLVPTERTVGDNTTIDVEMEEDEQALDEVIVIGYGTVTRSDVTGSVSQINSEKFANVPATDPLEAMQGRMPGIQITPSSGRPGAGSNVLVRGTQSINGTNAPIYVVDGTITESIDNINPQDIENISLLKDASAVAIYGARAANGVILVTTKRGEGDLSITFSTQQSIQEEGNLRLGYLNADQWLELYGESILNAGQSLPWTEEDLAEYEGVDVAWPDAVKRKGILSQYDLSVSNAGEKSNYFVSTSYMKNEGLIQGEDYSRINFRINTDHEISERITFGNSLNIYSSTENMSRDYDGRQVYQAAFRYTPLNRMYEDDGDFGRVRDVLFEGRSPSPLWLLENSAVTNEEKGAIGNLYLSIDLFEGLKFTTRGSAEWNQLHGTGFMGAMDPRYNMEGSNVNRVEKESGESLHWITDFLLEYNQIFQEDHSVNALLGYSLEEDNFEYLWGSRGDTPSNNIRFLGAGDPTTALNDNYFVDWSIRSLFGRIGYTYKNKYILNSTVRRDATSRLPEDTRSGTFPAISAAWRITEENFMDQVQWLDELKLRASWGVVGSSQGISPYGTRRFLNQRNYVLNQQPAIGYTVTDAVNTDLTWESTTKKNFGFDAYFLNSELYIISDFFIEDTRDLLFQQPIPSSTGLSGSPFINAGHVRNKGVEVELGYRKLSGDWSFDFNANVSHVRNEVIDLDGRDLRTSGIVEGHPLRTAFGYRSNGLIRTQDDLDNHPHLEGKQIGDIWLLDINGVDENGELTGEPDGKVDAADRTLVGSPFPDLTYGFFGSAGFKDFTLQVQLEGMSGRDQDMRASYATDAFTNEPNVEADYILDRFHSEKNPGGRYPRVAADDGGQNTTFSDFWLVDASYLSIRNVNLNYKLSSSISEDLGVNSFNIYAGVQNLYTFGNVYAQANNITSSPIPRKWTLGLRVAF